MHSPVSPAADSCFNLRMPLEVLLPLAVCVLFAATLTRSTFGFGDALVAMPLLCFFIDVNLARPAVALVSISAAAVIVASDWRHVDFHSAWRLIAASLCGITVAFVLWQVFRPPVESGPPAVPAADSAAEGTPQTPRTPPRLESAIKLALGVFIVAFGVWRLARPTVTQLEGNRWAYPFGFVAGTLGFAFNIHGPPLVVYGTFKRWPPPQFRATLQGYVLPAGAAVAASHFLSGLWTPTVFWIYLAAIGPAVAAIFLGRWLNRKLRHRGFARYVFVLLIIIGTALAMQSAWTLVAA